MEITQGLSDMNMNSGGNIWWHIKHIYLQRHNRLSRRSFRDDSFWMVILQVVPVIHVMTLLLPWLDCLQVDNRVYLCVQPPTKIARQSQRSLCPGSLGPTVDRPLMSMWGKIKQTEGLCLIRQHPVDVSSLFLTDN